MIDLMITISTNEKGTIGVTMHSAAGDCEDTPNNKEVALGSAVFEAVKQKLVNCGVPLVDVTVIPGLLCVFKKTSM
jgi:hypothetical protein